MRNVASEMNMRNEPFGRIYSNDFIVEHLEGKYGKNVIGDLLVKCFFRHRHCITFVTLESAVAFSWL